MTRADQIRDAALGPKPRLWRDNILAEWVDPHDALSACYDFVCELEQWWNRRVDIDTRRTFLLLVAEAIEP